jgi:hypothetical protein
MKLLAALQPLFISIAKDRDYNGSLALAALRVSTLVPLRY